MIIPPMPDEFIAYREWKYVRNSDGTYTSYNINPDAPLYWRQGLGKETWGAETAWASAVGDRLLAGRKAEGGLIGREVTFTPEIVPRRKADAMYSGIGFYFNKPWQRFEDDRYYDGAVFVCSALTDEGAYLERVGSDGRSSFHCIPDAYIRFRDVQAEEMIEQRKAWLAARASEGHMPFVASTFVRANVSVWVSPYDTRKVLLQAGDRIDISERYVANGLHPGIGKGGEKHFDVRTAEGQVLQCVDGMSLAVTMDWSMPDLPYGGPTILDECRVRF